MNRRYSAQISLNNIGPEGQQRLSRSSAVVVGAGGLGCPALTYLVAAGVGRVGIIDSDTVSLGNLNRQFLYTAEDIGRHKADAADSRLAAINSAIHITACRQQLSGINAASVLAGYDIVLGAVDNLDTRLIINRTAAEMGIPYIDGGVGGYNGYAMMSNPPDTACLNCVFQNRSVKKQPAGILGATAGVIGAMEANLALLWLLERRNPLKNTMLLYDGLSMRIDRITIRRDAHCPVCGSGVV